MEVMKKDKLQFYVPSQILSEILYHLPQKSLARFKTVSKQWYSCIHNYNFADEYNCRNNPGLSYFFVLASDRNTGQNIRVYDIGSDSYTYVRTIKIPDCYQSILPSSFGLVCLYSVNHDIAVFNPTTREIITLPDYCERVNVKVGYDLCCNELAFGYDPRSRTYKVVQMVHDWTGAPTLRSCYVLTVTRSGSCWRAMDLSLDGENLTIRSEPLIRCVDGALYFETHQRGLRDSIKILMFKLSCDEVHVIDAPENPNSIMYYEQKCLVEFQERLGFAQFTSTGALLTIDISVLNYSEGCISWNRLYNVNFGPDPNTHFPPLAFFFIMQFFMMQNRIFLMDQQRLCSYDVKEKSFKTYDENEDKEFWYWAKTFRAIIHTETLVFLH